MATERRQNRVAEFIREEVAVLVRNLNDPRVGFITILSVDIAQDLKIAKIFYSVFGSEADKRTTSRALQHAKGFLRKKIGSALQIKSVPEIEFILYSEDDKQEPNENLKIFNLIEKARKSDPDYNETKE